MRVKFSDGDFALFAETDFEASWLEEKFFNYRHKAVLAPKRLMGVSASDLVGYKFKFEESVGYQQENKARYWGNTLK